MLKFLIMFSEAGFNSRPAKLLQPDVSQIFDHWSSGGILGRKFLGNVVGFFRRWDAKVDAIFLFRKFFTLYLKKTTA